MVNQADSAIKITQVGPTTWTIRGYTKPYADDLKAAGATWDARTIGWRFEGSALPSAINMLAKGLTTFEAPIPVPVLIGGDGVTLALKQTVTVNDNPIVGLIVDLNVKAGKVCVTRPNPSATTNMTHWVAASKARRADSPIGENPIHADAETAKWGRAVRAQEQRARAAADAPDALDELVKAVELGHTRPVPADPLAAAREAMQAVREYVKARPPATKANLGEGDLLLDMSPGGSLHEMVGWDGDIPLLRPRLVKRGACHPRSRPIWWDVNWRHVTTSEAAWIARMQRAYRDLAKFAQTPALKTIQPVKAVSSSSAFAPPLDVTPLRKQYLDIKAQYPNCLLFFRLGDFYELFDEDAEIAAKELDLVLTGRPMVMDTVYGDGRARAKPADEPLPTQTQRQSFALVTPFIVPLRKDNQATSIDEPLVTITSGGGHHALVTPFLVVLKNSWSPDGKYTLPPLSINEPLTTIVASASQHGLVVPFIASQYNGRDAVSSVENSLPTVSTFNNQHYLVTPPIIVETGGVWERGASSVEEPMPTQLTRQSMSLVTPFVMSYYGNAPTYATTDEALPAITTVQRHALITPDEMLNDCGFRMLSPDELKLGMSFPESYIILGNKRDQVKQVGNAVCPNVAQIIVERCVESLL